MNIINILFGVCIILAAIAMFFSIAMAIRQNNWRWFKIGVVAGIITCTLCYFVKVPESLGDLWPYLIWAYALFFVAAWLVIKTSPKQQKH